MRRLRALRGLVTLLVCVGAAGGARAESRVAPLTPRLTPPASVEIVERFHAALARALEQSRGLNVVPFAEIRLAQARPELLACDAAECLQRLAGVLMAQRLLALDLQVTGKSYAVRLRVFDELGREVSRADGQCEICTLAEAEQTVARMGTAIDLHLPAATPPPASAPTPPPGPPATQPAPPPSPPSTAPWAGAAPPTPRPPPPPSLVDRAHRWNWKLIGVVAAGVAVVGIASGAPLVAVSGRPTCDLPSPRTTCPEVYATTGGGAVLLTVGLLAAAAAGTSFYLHWRWRDYRATVTPAPTPHGATLGARLDF